MKKFYIPLILSLLVIVSPINSSANTYNTTDKMLLLMNKGYVKVQGNWTIMATKKFDTTYQMKKRRLDKSFHLNIKLSYSIIQLAEHGVMIRNCSGYSKKRILAHCLLVRDINFIPIVVASKDHKYGKYSDIREYHLGGPASNVLVLYSVDKVNKIIWLLGIHNHQQAQYLYGKN